MSEPRSWAVATRRAGWAALLGVGLGIGCAGGESVISGLGNSENQIGTAALWIAVLLTSYVLAYYL